MTTGGFTSEQLELEESILVFPQFDALDAVELGEIAMEIGLDRSLPIAIEVRMGEWVVFHASLPGSTMENDRWIARTSIDSGDGRGGADAYHRN